MDRIGRIATLRLALSGCCVMLVAFSAVTSVHGVTGVTVAFEFFSSGVWGSMYLYTPEVLPTPIRALGLGCCSAVMRVAGMLSPGLGQMLSAEGMLSESIIIYGAIYAVRLLDPERWPRASWRDAVCCGCCRWARRLRSRCRTRRRGSGCRMASAASAPSKPRPPFLRRLRCLWLRCFKGGCGAEARGACPPQHGDEPPVLGARRHGQR